MADFPGSADALVLWSMVNGAVHDPDLRAQGFGDVVRDAWARITAGYVEGTVSRLPGLQDVNRMVSLAAEQYRAEQELGRAIDVYTSTGLDQGIAGSMRARDIDTGAGAGFNYPATDRIRFQIKTTVDGVEITRWVTYQPGIAGPTTVAQLLDMAEQAGRGFADDYGEEYGGLGGGFSLTGV